VLNFDHAVIRHKVTGQIIAFANLMKAGDQSELSMDLMRYDPEGSNAAMDALFADMLLWGKEQGFAWFSLGAAPLSDLENRKLAPAWHRIGSFLHEHRTQFYHFDGLRAFKQKFDPKWSPEYLACSGRLDAARVLYEVSLLVSRGVKGMSNHATSIKAAKIQLKPEAGIKSFWLSRDTGHSCNTQHTVKWAPSRLAAVQKETEFLGNMNVSSRCLRTSTSHLQRRSDFRQFC
jgi:hypothetical protein